MTLWETQSYESHVEEASAGFLGAVPQPVIHSRVAAFVNMLPNSRKLATSYDLTGLFHFNDFEEC